MLVLSRKKGDSIMIGHQVEIVIVDSCDDRGRVRVGINAPRDIEVHRREIYEKLYDTKKTV